MKCTCLRCILLAPANKVWGKVMFLHVYTCLSFLFRGGSLYDVTSCMAAWSHVPSRRSLSLVPCGVCLPGVCLYGVWLQGKLGRRPPEPEKRAVRILLKCFLVFGWICSVQFVPSCYLLSLIFAANVVVKKRLLNEFRVMETCLCVTVVFCRQKVKTA